MFTTSLRIALTAVLIVEAIGDGDDHNIEKRHVSILARMGSLPSYQGKRMERSSLDELAERLEDEQSGDLRMLRENDEKREDIEGLVHDLAATEEMRRSRLEALRDELFRERETDGNIAEEKRSMAALARAGALPKRVMDDEDEFEEDELEDKRGLSSIARNGYYQKRIGDDDLEQLMSEVYGIGEKRSVASLARGFSLPQGKRNIGSIVRGKKDSFEETSEEKRNIPSIMRDRSESLGEGKRHIGSYVANHGIPFVNDKRNLGALAKNRDFPYASKGKRNVDEAMAKRYVATLLRQGRLPVATDMTEDEMSLKEAAQEDAKDDTVKIANDDSEGSRTKRELARDDMDNRYFGVRGGGKMPGGRLPKVGSRRTNRHENSGRRRH